MALTIEQLSDNWWRHC